MADLKAMFGKKKDATDSTTTPTATTATDAATKAVDVAVDATSQKANADAPKQPRANPFARPAAAVPPADKQTESAKPKLAGLKLPNEVSGSAPAASAKTPSQSAPIDSLDDLDNLDVSDISMDVEAPRSRFADETPATKPTRELPEGLEKQQLQFVDLLDGMYEILHDPELLGNVVKSMMIELGANPQYKKLLSPSDVRLVVRAARDSMGIARVKKTEAKAKRGTGKSAAKAIDNDMLQDLADMGIEL